MANPADPGEFELWITDRIGFQDIPPLSGDTGDFERWITDRIFFEDYVEAVVAAVGPFLTTMAGYSVPVGV